MGTVAQVLDELHFGLRGAVGDCAQPHRFRTQAQLEDARLEHDAACGRQRNARGIAQFEVQFSGFGVLP